MDKKSPDALRDKFDGIAKNLIKARKSSPGAEVKDTFIAEKTYKSLSDSMKKHGKNLVDASEEQQHIYETVIRDTFDFIGNDHVDAKTYQAEMLELLHKTSALSDKDNPPDVTDKLKDIIKNQIQISKEDRLSKGISKGLGIASLAFFSPAFAAGLDVIGDKASNLLKGGIFKSETTNKIEAAETRGTADKQLMEEGIDTAFQSDSIKKARKSERNREEFGHSGNKEFDGNTSHTHTVDTGGKNSSDVNSVSVKTMNVDTLIVKNIQEEGGKSSENIKSSEAPQENITPEVSSDHSPNHKTATENGNSSYKPKRESSVTDVVPKPKKIPSVLSSDIIDAPLPRKSNRIKKAVSDITDIVPKLKTAAKTAMGGDKGNVVQKLLGQRNTQVAMKQYEPEVTTPETAGGIPNLPNVPPGLGKIAAGVGRAALPVAAVAASGVAGYELGKHVVAPAIDTALSAATGKDTSLGTWIYDKTHPDTPSPVRGKMTPSSPITANITPADIDKTMVNAKADNLAKTQSLQMDIDEKDSLKMNSDGGNKAPVVITNNNTTQAPASKSEETMRPAPSRDSDATFKRWQENSFFN